MPSHNKMSVTEEAVLLQLLRTPATYEQGFRTLLAQYQERLYWHIRHLVLTHEDTDDVLQNTFIKVHKSIGAFEEKSALFTWLYRIATNEALTFLAQRQRKTTQDIEATTVAAQLRADNYFDGDEAQQKLQSAIAALPEKQRVVFTMRYYEEMPYEQMSAILQTSVGALKASYHHAAHKIEDYLRQQ